MIPDKIYIDQDLIDFHCLKEHLNDDEIEYIRAELVGCPKESDNCYGLEEAAEEYASLEYDCHSETDAFYAMLQKDGFIAGAKWQKKQDQETIELAEDHAMMAGMNKAKAEFDQKCQGCFNRDEVYWKGMQHARTELEKDNYLYPKSEYELDWLDELKKDLFEEGRKAMNEEMMKEAVEADIDFDFIDKDARTHVVVRACVVEDDYGILAGEKCKCLILKDDETESD